MERLKRNTILSWLKQHPTYFAALLYAIILIVSFFPLFTGSASLNWDAFDLWMPWKHFITEELYAGDLPLWNPYFRNGFPQHGDTMTWYPISWALGFLFGGYNLFSLNLEYVLHLFIAGTGMFALVRRFSQHQMVNFLIGLSFMLSGFMIGNAQHVSWIISAAWMPWYFLALFELRDKQHIKQLAVFSLTGYLLFSGGYLAIFFVIVYLTIFLFIWFYYNKLNISVWRFYRYFILGALIISALSLPLLLSVYEIFPLFNRYSPEEIGQGLDIQLGATPWNGVVSILFPLSSGVYNVPELEFGTFSTFFGAVPFLLLAAKFKTIYVNRRFLILFIIALLALMCSMGDIFPIRKLVSLFPLMDLFRYPTLFRLFSIFIALVLLAMVLEYSPLKKSAATKTKEKWGLLFIGTLLVFISAIIFITADATSIHHYLQNVFHLKPLDGLVLNIRFGLNLALMGLLFLGLSIWWFRRKYLPFYRFILITWGLEMVLIALTSAPHVVYHPVNVPWANHVIQSQPLEKPAFVADHENQEKEKWQKYVQFSWQSKTFYTKQFSSLWYNPLYIKAPTNQADILDLKTNESTPFIGVLNKNNIGELSVVKNDSIVFDIISNQHWKISYPSSLEKGSFIFIKQRYVNEWSAHSNETELNIKQSTDGFMLIETDYAPNNAIELKYNQSDYLIAFWIAVSLFLVVTIILFIYSPYKREWTTILLLLLITGFVNNRHRFYTTSNIQLTEKNSVSALDFQSGAFASLDFWKQKNDTLYIPINFPKTDQSIAYLQHLFPVYNHSVLVNNIAYSERSKGDLNVPIFKQTSDLDSSAFNLDLHSIVKKERLYKDVLLFTFTYTSSIDSGLNFWVSHKRSGEWVNGNAWSLASLGQNKSDMLLVSAIDMSSYSLLPEDELVLFVWGEEDGKFAWKDFSISLLTVP